MAVQIREKLVHLSKPSCFECGVDLTFKRGHPKCFSCGVIASDFHPDMRKAVIALRSMGFIVLGAQFEIAHAEKGNKFEAYKDKLIKFRDTRYTWTTKEACALRILLGTQYRACMFKGLPNRFIPYNVLGKSIVNISSLFDNPPTSLYYIAPDPEEVFDQYTEKDTVYKAEIVRKVSRYIIRWAKTMEKRSYPAVWQLAGYFD